jgi:hypothetical protein
MVTTILRWDKKKCYGICPFGPWSEHVYVPARALVNNPKPDCDLTGSYVELRDIRNTPKGLRANWAQLTSLNLTLDHVEKFGSQLIIFFQNWRQLHIGLWNYELQMAYTARVHLENEKATVFKYPLKVDDIATFTWTDGRTGLGLYSAQSSDWTVLVPQYPNDPKSLVITNRKRLNDSDHLIVWDEKIARNIPWIFTAIQKPKNLIHELPFNLLLGPFGTAITDCCWAFREPTLSESTRSVFTVMHKLFAYYFENGFLSVVAPEDKNNASESFRVFQMLETTLLHFCNEGTAHNQIVHFTDRDGLEHYVYIDSQQDTIFRDEFVFAPAKITLINYSIL